MCRRNLSNPDIFPLTRSAVSTCGRNSLLSARAFRPAARSCSATSVHNCSHKSCTCPGRAAPAIRIIRLQRERRVIKPRFREAAKRHSSRPRPTVYRPSADHACVPPTGQNEFGITIVTLPLESTLQAVFVALAVPTVVSHDDQQLVELRSMQPNVLFQSLGNTNQLPSGDIRPMAFCPLKFQLSPVLNV